LRSKNAFLRVLGAFALALSVAFIAGCGGGGGSSAGNTNGTNGTSTPNQVTLTVDKGLQSVANLATVSVTVCAPGTSTCQSIDHVQVDTMSYGLRLVSSAASQVLGNLPFLTDSGGNQIAECTVFADGFTWGSVRTADVKIGGETANGISISILGDMGTAPSSCTSQTPGGAENTVSALGVNGVLGIGVAPFDCGSFCVSNANNGTYFSCPNTGCTEIPLGLANQVANPVAKFASDNNGVRLTMQAVGSPGSSGARSASGTLTFGIGTQSNNALSGVQQFATDSIGRVNSTTFGGSGSGFAFFDSGSNAYFFDDSTLTQCPNTSSFYCPPAPTSRSVTISSFSGAATSTTVAMTILNANTLFGTGNFAFNDLAGPLGSSSIIDVGLPFFYGRAVYFGYDQRPLGGAQTPYVAF
jgi:Protein of unknown function (DUF3443)